jgi:glycosyltransferase involved in cell wall biosynthesis
LKISPVTPEQVVKDLAKAMIRLAEDKELRISMGQAGQKLVSTMYSWEARGKYLAQLYQQVSTRS